MLVSVPLAFGGDDQASGPDAGTAPTAATAAALEVRAEVEELNEAAREEAPPAVGNGCDRTLDVEGVGDACVTRDGLLRVEQADGRSHTIHGLDAPPLGASALAPGSQAAVNGADVNDITCVPDSQPHYVLVYARPGNVTSRYATIAPKLRVESYRMSAFIDGESHAVDPGASRRLPMRCEGGAPVVLNATLSGLSDGSAAFKDVVDGFRALGYQYNGDGAGTERYIVYYDSPSPSGAAGTGHVFTTDARGEAGNENNKSGLYAVEYRYAGGGGVPHWEVLIHEVMHTMGAVVGAAANSSGAGHCIDGQDVMCYDDGGSRGSSYDGSTCAVKQLDCGRNDYFNPSPAPGTFLAANWNAGATYNRWLDNRSTGDASAPTTVTGLVQTGASNSTIGVAWNPASDDKGVGGYVVSVRPEGGTWRDVTTTTRRSATVPGLSPSTTYDVGVVARDASGNASERTIVSASTSDVADMSAPGAPTGVTAKSSATTVTFAWREAGDDVGVADYELRRRTVSAIDPSRRDLRSAGTTRDTTITIPARGLKPGVRYEFEVVARDDAANVSTGTVVRVTIPKDVKKPTAPARLRAASKSSSSVVLTWGASRDDVALKDYGFYQKLGGRWTLRARLPATATRLKVTKLRRGTSYTFRIQARDTSGNLSAPSRALVVRM